MFGINGPEFLVLALIALLVVGPERLPQYAAQLGRIVRELRRMANGAREQVRSELGPEFDDIDWQKLDPRQYDPRRIVREALSDAWDDEPASRGPIVGSRDGNPTVRGSGATAAGPVGSQADVLRARRRPPGSAMPAPPPFDSEAT
ncbi:MAG: sec-independent translocase [Actinomycetes bacterium]